jgi:hypothetical protein
MRRGSEDLLGADNLYAFRKEKVNALEWIERCEKIGGRQLVIQK